jgi:hypothetical protein
MKFAIIHWWANFDYYNNCYKDRFFNGWEQTNDYENADIVLIGTFTFYNSNGEEQIRRIKGKKVLFITEPLIDKYQHLINENMFDLIFGCVNNDNENRKYKFPLGFFYFYSFDRNKLSLLNDANMYVKTCNLPNDFCCLINGHDRNGLRTPPYNLLKQLGHIVCPGRLLNNCSNEELDRMGKIEYLKKFKFNICSENTLNLDGYITEKLLECCMGGAIPIYAGNFDDIDEKIYNIKRILFYNPHDEKSVMSIFIIIEILLSDEKTFELFYRQPIFMDSSINTILELEDSLVNGIKNLTD